MYSDRLAKAHINVMQQDELSVDFLCLPQEFSQQTAKSMIVCTNMSNKKIDLISRERGSITHTHFIGPGPSSDLCMS